MPASLRIKYWLKRNWASLYPWLFATSGLLCLVAYPLVREHRMIGQGGKVVVKASTMTPALIICLLIIGWGYQKLVIDRLSGRHWTLKWGSILPLWLILSLFLEAMGYDMRFW